MPLFSAPEVIIVEDDVDEVRCDGGGGALGHPMVWYSFSGQDKVSCGYCDRLFIKQSAAQKVEKQIAQSTVDQVE